MRTLVARVVGCAAGIVSVRSEGCFSVRYEA